MYLYHIMYESNRTFNVEEIQRITWLFTRHSYVQHSAPSTHFFNLCFLYFLFVFSVCVFKLQPPSPYHISLLERHTSFFCADTIFPRSHSLPSSFFENDFKLLNSILSHITMHCVTAINSFMCVRQCCPHCCLLALSTPPHCRGLKHFLIENCNPLFSRSPF